MWYGDVSEIAHTHGRLGRIATRDPRRARRGSVFCSLDDMASFVTRQVRACHVTAYVSASCALLDCALLFALRKCLGSRKRESGAQREGLDALGTNDAVGGYDGKASLGSDHLRRLLRQVG